MSKFAKHILLGIFSVAWLNIYCQNGIELFSFGYRNNILPGPDAETVYSSKLTIPILLPDSNTFFNKLSYSNYNVVFDSAQPSNATLNGLTLRTGIIKRLSNHHRLHVFVTPCYMSNVWSANRYNLQIGGAVLLETSKKKRYSSKIGFSYKQEKFGPYLVPLYYLDWRPSDNFRIYALLPINTHIQYSFAHNMHLGLYYTGGTKTFSISQAGQSDRYIERSNINSGFFFRINTTKNIVLIGRVGKTTNRNYTLYEKNEKIKLKIPLTRIGDNRNKNILDNSKCLYLEFGIAYCLER